MNLLYGFYGFFNAKVVEYGSLPRLVDYGAVPRLGRGVLPAVHFAVSHLCAHLDRTWETSAEHTCDWRTSVDSALADPDGPGPLPPDKPVPPVQDSDTVAIIFPTGVVLAGFEAAAQPDGVQVTWVTASELDILGFNLLRSDAGGDGSTELAEVFVAVNDHFIFAEYAGADFGASYGYLDAALPPGLYAYTLEIVKLDGSVERYGLAEVVVG